MNDDRDRKQVTTTDTVGAVAQLIRTLRLVWRLMQDSRVPIFPKLIIPAAILYALSPIDLIPDMILGLGQIDDCAVLFFSISLFVEMCPPDIVAEHRRALAARSKSTAWDEDVVEGSYRVVSDDENPHDNA